MRNRLPGNFFPKPDFRSKCRMHDDLKKKKSDRAERNRSRMLAFYLNGNSSTSWQVPQAAV